MAKRTYDQPGCGLAAALDLLGERWTLLVIRELMLGPQRYTDLHGALSAMSTNLLAGRLRSLEEQGVVQRTELPPPAACTVYELTEVGQELEPLILQMAQWGSRFVDCDNLADPRGAAFAMLAAQREISHRADITTGECQIDIGDMTIAAYVETGRVRARAHAPTNPVATLRATPESYLGLVSGELEWSDLDADGDLQQLAALFGEPPAN